MISHPSPLDMMTVESYFKEIIQYVERLKDFNTRIYDMVNDQALRVDRLLHITTMLMEIIEIAPAVCSDEELEREHALALLRSRRIYDIYQSIHDIHNHLSTMQAELELIQPLV